MFTLLKEAYDKGNLVRLMTKDTSYPIYGWIAGGARKQLMEGIEDFTFTLYRIKDIRDIIVGKNLQEMITETMVINHKDIVQAEIV